METLPRNGCHHAQPAASRGPPPSRMTPQASPKRSPPSSLGPGCRQPMAIRSSLSGGSSPRLCSPPVGQSKPAGQKNRLRHGVHEPTSAGRGVGASSSSAPISLVRQSRPWQHAPARRPVVCPAADASSDRWGISATRRTAQPTRPAHGNSCARRSQRWETISVRRCRTALPLTGSTPCGIGGQRAWGSLGVGRTPRRGCVCDADWRNTTTGSGVQQPGNILCRSLRRCSPSPSTLPSVSSKALKWLSYRVCKRWDTPEVIEFAA